MTHIDDWIRTIGIGKPEEYAKFFFMLARLPAWMQIAFYPWTKQFKLFCTYDGSRYRVTGASRLGDVWLTNDLNSEEGYDLRVDVAKCSGWSDTVGLPTWE